MKRVARIVALCGLGLASIPALAAPELISVGTRGIPAASSQFDMTPDGRYVVFASRSSTLVAGDTNNRSDVFMRDRVNRTVERVSVSTDGLQANSDSDQPRITPDGRYVVFRSFASNLVLGDTNLAGDVFIRDLVGRVTWRMSVGPGRIQANGPSWNPRISDDGRVVSFVSSATNLDPWSTRIEAQVYVRDERYAFTHVVSLAEDGSLPNEPSANLDLSGDGTLVLFDTAASNMTEYSDWRDQAYVFNRRFATTTCLSMLDTETTFFTGSSNGVLSADGRYAILAIDEFGDSSWFGVGLLMRVNLGDGAYELISRDSFGRLADGELGERLAVSTNGRYVGWISDSDALSPEDANGAPDVFVRDLATGTTARKSFSATSNELNEGVDSEAMVVVADDGVTAYASASMNLGVPVDSSASVIVEDGAAPLSSDLTFWDAQTSRVLIGQLAGNKVANFEWGTQALSSSWTLVGVGEFNRDGYADIVAQHTTSRLLAIGYMRGSEVNHWAWVSQIPNAGWNTVGVGDFSRGGQSSLLFQHPTTNRMVIARTDRATVMDWWNVNQVPNSGWRTAAVADFDADGFADIAFQRDSTGQVTIAMSQLGTVINWRNFSQWPNPGWALKCAGDFDGDGKPDLAFQHATTGLITLAYCDGIQVLRWASVNPPRRQDGSAYELLGAGRF